MPPKPVRPLGQMRLGLKKSSLASRRAQEQISQTTSGGDVEATGSRRLSFLDDILTKAEGGGTNHPRELGGLKSFNITNSLSAPQNSFVQHHDGGHSPGIPELTEVDDQNGGVSEKKPSIPQTESSTKNTKSVTKSTTDPSSFSEITTSKISSNRTIPKSKNSMAERDATASKLGIDLTSVHRELEKREKNLQRRVGELENEILEIRITIVDRDSQIHKLKQNIQDITIQLDSYRPLYEAEVKTHAATKEELTQLRHALTQRSLELAQLRGEQEGKLRDLVRSYEVKLVDLAADKDKLVANLEDKIDRMKKQMASAFDGNAWERQHQIEELSKELKKLQDENDSHRFQMKKRTASGVCKDCDRYAQLIQEVSEKLTEKEIILSKMSLKCSEFEKLLKSQNK